MTPKDSPSVKKIDEFARGILRDLYNQCTPEQQKVFNWMYPQGIDNIPIEKLAWPICQCERTIEKNNKIP